MTNVQKVVTPAKAGVQCVCNHRIFLDAGFRRHDVERRFPAFYEGVRVDRLFLEKNGIIG